MPLLTKIWLLQGCLASSARVSASIFRLGYLRHDLRLLVESPLIFKEFKCCRIFREGVVGALHWVPSLLRQHCCLIIKLEFLCILLTLLLVLGGDGVDYRCRLDLDYLLAGAHVLELGIICKFQNSGLLLRRCLHSSHTLHAIIRCFAVGRHWVSVGFFSPPSTSR